MLVLLQQHHRRLNRPTDASRFCLLLWKALRHTVTCNTVAARPAVTATRGCAERRSGGAAPPGPKPAAPFGPTAQGYAWRQLQDRDVPLPERLIPQFAQQRAFAAGSAPGTSPTHTRVPTHPEEPRHHPSQPRCGVSAAGGPSPARPGPAPTFHEERSSGGSGCGVWGRGRRRRKRRRGRRRRKGRGAEQSAAEGGRCGAVRCGAASRRVEELR